MPKEVRDPAEVEAERIDAGVRSGMDRISLSMANTLALLQAVDRMRTAGMILNAALGAAVIGALKGRPETERALALAVREAGAAERHYRDIAELSARLAGRARD